MSNFHPFKVVDRGSETQLQVGEKLMQHDGGNMSVALINDISL